MKWLYSVLVLVALVIIATDAHKVCIPVPASTHQCLKRSAGRNQLSAGLSCLQDLLWDMVPDMSLNQRDLSLLSQISHRIGIMTPAAMTMSGGRNFGMYPPSGKRRRKEYRLLTTWERERFHSALNRLYQDGFIDLFAKIHAEAAERHHGGASFLPWHRAYLTMFEEVLRMYDPSVSLPYWASTIDCEMGNPVNSILWTPEYFGNGNGIVTSGPAAGWTFQHGGLERDYGQNTTLFTRQQIDSVLSQCRLANISRPTAMNISDFEGFHGGPHNWVGGDLSALATAGYDPVFYMHHCYVDYIWERFRQRQMLYCGVDPSSDYPEVPLGDSNHPDTRMTGFEWFVNRDGIASYWTDYWFTYEPEPTCPNCCPFCSYPPPIQCNRRRNACVSRSKLFDERGRLIPSMVYGYQAHVRAIQSGRVRRPRNRGKLFDAPPSDGRTIMTALTDAMRAAPEAIRAQFRAFL